MIHANRNEVHPAVCPTMLVTASMPICGPFLTQEALLNEYFDSMTYVYIVIQVYILIFAEFVVKVMYCPTERTIVFLQHNSVNVHKQSSMFTLR